MTRLGALFRKARGLLGLGVFSGIAGAVVGALWAAADQMMGPTMTPLIMEMFERAMGGGLAGLACGMGFGALLVTLESKKSLEALPLWRMALLGAAVGVTLPTVFMLLTSGTFHFVHAPQIVVSVLGTGAVLGGVMSSSLVGLAKGAHRAEMAVVEEVAGLIEAD